MHTLTTDLRLATNWLATIGQLAKILKASRVRLDKDYVCLGVSNHWNGIWNGTVEWKMEWNGQCS